MNIAELCHRQQTTQQAIVPHCPVFVLEDQLKEWYFCSAHKANQTLRKKQVNTMLLNFLLPEGGEKRLNTTILFVICIANTLHTDDARFHPVSVRKVTLAELVGQSRGKLTEKEVMGKFVPERKQKYVIVRVDEFEEWKLFSLQWSEEFIYCTAPINSQQKQTLTNYCAFLKGLVEKRLNELVERFELIFLMSRNAGSCQLLFIQNVKVKCEEKVYFRTGYLCQTDDYQRVQNMHKQLFNHQQQQTRNHQIQQLNKLKYLKFINRLVKENHQVQMGGRVQENPKCQKKDFKCAGCHCFVEDEANGKTITRNHLPKIQYLRHVRMSVKNDLNQLYDLVSVCNQCYQQFLMIHKSKKTAQEKSQTSLESSSQQRRKRFPLKQKLKQREQKKFYIAPTEQRASLKKTKLALQREKNNKTSIKPSRKYSLNTTENNEQNTTIKTVKYPKTKDETIENDEKKSEWEFLQILEDYERGKRKQEKKHRPLGVSKYSFH